jgi:alpha-ketoglutaric semialdehyde dehydrogenase
MSGSAGSTSAPSTRPLGVSLIAGRPAEPEPGSEFFQAANPATGANLSERFAPASISQVGEAANEAWRAFHLGRYRSADDRAALLELIASRLRGMADHLLPRCHDETGLPGDRLRTELERTTSTLELFAGVVRDQSWRRVAIDPADPARRPRPRPDLRRMLVPLGPVAVFGASNFPLAYSTAGTDSASALAAGCPVIVKGHPLHPGTGELVAQAVCGAVRDAGFPDGWFSFLHSGGGREREIGTELVRHPCVRAAGFTGSFAGGTALARIASERPDPIPFFAEMGATNPVFLLPGSLETEPIGIAEHLAKSISDFAGQQCTCPGLIFVTRGGSTETFTERLARELEGVPGTPMLASRIRRAYLRRLESMVECTGVRLVLGDIGRIRGEAERIGDTQPTREAPVLLRCKADAFVGHETLHEEAFGPAALVVECEDVEEMLRCAGVLQGSLTASVFMSNSDLDVGEALTNILSLRAGRLVFNGVPTGVEVSHAMVHGGPFPSTNRPESTAVGPMALERWCRPVTLQNAPTGLLPPLLRDDNPGGVTRLVRGVSTDGDVG